jgi:hypothetical protein
MRSFFVLSVMAVLLGFGPSVAADPEPGSLVQVPVNSGAKTVEAKVGDLLQFELKYPVVPDKLVSSLTLEISGRGMKHITTVHVPQRDKDGHVVVGAMGIAAFVKVERAGDYTVRIIPRLANGNDGEKTKLKIKVEDD